MPSSINGHAIAGGEANALLVGAAANRRVVILNPPDAGDYQIAFGASATLSPHVRMTAASAPVILTKEMMGEVINSDIRVTADVGAVALVTIISGA